MHKYHQSFIQTCVHLYAHMFLHTPLEDGFHHERCLQAVDTHCRVRRPGKTSYESLRRARLPVGCSQRSKSFKIREPESFGHRKMRLLCVKLSSCTRFRLWSIYMIPIQRNPKDPKVFLSHLETILHFCTNLCNMGVGSAMISLCPK